MSAPNPGNWPLYELELTWTNVRGQRERQRFGRKFTMRKTADDTAEMFVKLGVSARVIGGPR